MDLGYTQFIKYNEWENLTGGFVVKTCNGVSQYGDTAEEFTQKGLDL